ncbi:hypothetical protein GCM10027431_32720 [Lysobacter rhizosphaerae]
MNDKAHALRAALPDLAERTQGQLLELFNDATPDRAYIAARAAHEVYTVLVRLGGELERGEPKAA